MRLSYVVLGVENSEIFHSYLFENDLIKCVTMDTHVCSTSPSRTWSVPTHSTCITSRSISVTRSSGNTISLFNKSPRPIVTEIPICSFTRRHSLRGTTSVGKNAFFRSPCKRLDCIRTSSSTSKHQFVLCTLRVSNSINR